MTGKFPSPLKQANIVPIFKSGDTSNPNNYRPISLLNITSKLFEKIVFKYLYNHFRDNYILSEVQSGFLPGRSTVTQLLEINHKFCEAINRGKEVRVIFLDISKAFDKVWINGLLHKLYKAGLSDSLLKWFHSYLNNRVQRVVINGQKSCWGEVEAGVPQGSVLGPLLFLLYINDVTDAINHCNIRMFADDTCLFLEVDDRKNTASLIEKDLSCIEKWAKKWQVDFSAKKTKSLIVSNKKNSSQNPPLKFLSQNIEEVKSHKYLGIVFTNNLSWNEHINAVVLKAEQKLNMLKPLKFRISRKSLETLYNAFVLPTMEYSFAVWGGTYDTNILKLERVHVEGQRLITGATKRSNIKNLYIETGFENMMQRRDYTTLAMIFKIKNNLAPLYLSNLIPPEREQQVNYNIRRRNNLTIPNARIEAFRRSFFIFGSQLWNNLNQEVKNSTSKQEFKNKCKQKTETKVLYYYGNRWCNIHHSRLRMGCSKLNYDLFYNLHVIDSPTCRCGAPVENALHFFIQCPLYEPERITLRTKMETKTVFCIENVLFGDSHICILDNFFVFDAVHEYIKNSERFK